MTWKNEREVLVAIDIIFSNLGIYPPLMRETVKGQWAGEVDDGEFFLMHWQDGVLAGVVYDDNPFDNLEALRVAAGEIHRQFKHKKEKPFKVTGDMIFMLGDY